MTYAIVAKNLEKKHGSRTSLKNLSFELPNAAKLVIFGANGAGKTTLLRLLATIDKPSAGKLEILGKDSLKEGESIRAQLGFISHEPMLYPDLSAKENLLLFAKLYGVPDPYQRTAELLDKVHLTHRANDIVRGFSRGMTQRMSIARALIHDPLLVLLDEPFTGLDARAQEIARELFLKEDQNTQTRTIVMTSHNLEQGFHIATHVMLLSSGQLVTFTEKKDLDFDELATLYNSHLLKGERV